MSEKNLMVMMPSALTAENGAKGLLIGEFTERKRIDCPFCEDGRSNEDGCFCHACAGTGSIDDELQVSWVTIKAIYAKAVEHLGEPLTEQTESINAELLSAAKTAEKWMQHWLDEKLCECEGYHYCGRTEREAELAQIKTATRKGMDNGDNNQ